MPFKNEKVQKRYQHNWYLRKKAGLPTKTKPILTFEEKLQRKKKLRREQDKLIRQRKNKLIEDKIGKDCFFCGYGKRLTTHRKDGKNHIKFSRLSKKELIHELEKHSDEYVRLCYKCHKSVHWSMKYLGLSWKQISDFKIAKI